VEVVTIQKGPMQKEAPLEVYNEVMAKGIQLNTFRLNP
jgi:hypothetical protein